MTTVTHTPESRCPECGGKLNAASGMIDATPEPGDISICIHCTAILEFDEELMPGPVSDETRDSLSKTELKEINELRGMIQRAKSVLH